MKKIILSLGILIAVSFTAESQVNPHAIGLRSGGGSNGYGFGNEISYQHGMGDLNRLELDLGFRSHNTKNGFIGNGYRTSYMTFSGIYHWVNNIEGGFNWFVGPGAQIGLGSYKYNYSGITYSDSWVSIGLGGQIGIEYDFNPEFSIPIQLGFDIRPMLYLSNGNSNFNGDGALSVRYIF